MKKIIEVQICDWCGQERNLNDMMHRVYWESDENKHEPIDIHESCKKEAIISAVLGRKAYKQPTK